MTDSASSAERNSAQGRRRRRDGYLPLQPDDADRALEPLLARGHEAMRELALEAAYIRLSRAIVEDLEPLTTDDRIAARRTRMPARAWRSCIAELEGCGCAWRQGGGWMTALAALEIERRTRSRRGSQEVAGENPEKPNASNGGPAPASSSSSPTRFHNPNPTSSSLSPELRDRLEELVAQHRGDEAAAQLMAELARDRRRSRKIIDDDAAWSLGWLAKRGVNISPRALGPTEGNP